MAYGNTKPPDGSILIPDHPLAPLAGCWLFNENAGIRAKDLSPQGNHGTLTNMEPSTDWVGGALDFDGTDDYVRISDIYASGNVSYSLVFRVKFNAITNGRGVIQIGETLSDSAPSFNLQQVTGPNIRFYLRDVYSSNTPVSVGVWYQMVFAYDKQATAAASLGTLYIDGASVLTKAPTLFIVDNDLWIGNGFNGYANMQFDYCMMYDRVLNTTEIAQLYREPFCMIDNPVEKSYFFLTAGVSVSKQIAIPFEFQGLTNGIRALRWENLAFITRGRTQLVEELVPRSTSRSAPLEALASISKSRSSPLEALGLIAKGRTIPYEITSNIVAVSQSRILPIEFLAALARSRGIGLEYLAQASTNRVAQVEALASAFKGRSSALEILKGLSVGRTLPPAYLGATSNGRSILLDWLIPLSSSEILRPEYRSQASQGRSAILEILKGIASDRILPYEYASAAQITATANRTLAVEWRASVARSRTALLDFRSVLSKARAIILEWTAGLSVTLDPSSVYANILKSLNQYLVTNLTTTEGLNLDWGQPNFKEEGLERWLQSRLLWDERSFQRQVDTGQQGNIVDVRVEIDLFEKHPPRRNLYALDDEKDAVLEYLTLAVIPVYDYTSAGHPLVGEIRLLTLSHRGGEESTEDEGEESGLRQERVVIPGRYLEKFTI